MQSADDCIKLTLIQVSTFAQKFDITCLSETFLNFYTQNNDHKVKVDRYNLIRSDHPGGSKKVESVFITKDMFLLLVVTNFER